jgi:hypothetical protein
VLAVVLQHLGQRRKVQVDVARLVLRMRYLFHQLLERLFVSALRHLQNL